MRFEPGSLINPKSGALAAQTPDEIKHQMFVCVEVLWPSQLNEVMLGALSLSTYTFTGQA